MLTPFGKVLRKLRIDHELKLGELAKLLEVSAAFLSAVETGKKKVPATMVEQIAEKLKLKGQEVAQLKDAASDSPVTVRIELTKAGTKSRDVAVAFARAFDSFTENELEQFHKLLAKKGA